MPISATGRISRQGQRESAGSKGFTLLELLVVLTIIAIVISFAVLSIDTAGRELENEGSRLAALLNLASEEAVMNGREYKAVFNHRGYAFFAHRSGRWQRIDDDLLRPRQLPADLDWRLSIEGQEVVPENDDPAPDLSEENPTIYLLSGGEVTPFEVELSQSGGRKMIIGNREGVISAIPEG